MNSDLIRLSQVFSDVKVSVATLLIFCFILFANGCKSNEPVRAEFTELRIHRWTALEGGETLVLRKVGTEWSAMLLGDGSRFSCLYQREVTPKTNWNQLWNDLTSEGLLNLSGLEQDRDITDGNGFEFELTYQGKVRLYAVPHPADQKSDNAKRILKIADLISREFDTPVFVASYDRGKVGEYLITNCKKSEK